ncbi:protein of unknown function [Catalinimonas alkaloidigena]|uniref:DUF4168 domain-containing protein n=2 Tax=Catalinimonas alkaloidigena TaxID=1075417 RepID=A0A1G9GP60_9BACT|nr:protein of unknown function [Catalinimonas alkaloidigena]
MLVAIWVGICGGLVIAQTPPAEPVETPPVTYSQQELKQFALAVNRVNEIEQNANKRSLRAIEEENLNLDRFNEIVEFQQQQASGETLVSDSTMLPTEEELAAFTKAGEQINQIRTEVTSQIVRAIRRTGLEPEKFQEILLAYQQSPELQKQIDKMMGQENTTVAP